MDEKSKKEQILEKLSKVPEDFFEAYAINAESLQFQMHYSSGLIQKHRKNITDVILNTSGFTCFVFNGENCKIHVVMT